MRRLLLLSLVVFLFAGCGGSGGDADADPASALPPGSMYADLVVNPEGEQKEELTELARKVMRTDDPGRKLMDLIEEAETGAVEEYERDVKPWLGRRIGVGLTGFDKASEEPHVLVAFAASDAAEAEKAIARMAKANKEKRSSYKEVDLWTDAEGSISAAHGDFVYYSDSKKAIRQAIDLEEGKSMADDKRFKNAVGKLPEGRIGTMYFDFKGLVEQSMQLGGLERAMLGSFLNQPPTAVAVLADEQHVAIESRMPDEAARSLASMYGGLGYMGSTPLVGEAPADSWFTMGSPDFTEGAREMTRLLGGKALTGEIERELGISLERDVYSWMSDIAVFVRGTSLDELDGAVVIESKDAAKARRALPKLIGALQLQTGLPSRAVALEGASMAFELKVEDAPAAFYVAMTDTRVVIAMGRDAAGDALRPDAKLSDDDLWDRASGVLDGLEPSMLVDVPAAVSLMSDAAQDDADFAEAKPYLDTIDVMAAGAGEQDDQLRSRFAAGVK